MDKELEKKILKAIDKVDPTNIRIKTFCEKGYFTFIEFFNTINDNRIEQGLNPLTIGEIVDILLPPKK